MQLQLQVQTSPVLALDIRRQQRHLWLQVQQEATGSKQPYSVVAYGAFGGRLDQQMANLNMLFRRDFQCFERFVLLDHHSLALLLAPGAHAIEPCLDVEDGKCGLIPMGGACEAVTTQGLKWNLEGDGLEESDAEVAFHKEPGKNDQHSNEQGRAPTDLGYSFGRKPGRDSQNRLPN